MSSFTFQRLQCLHFHFKDFNIFSRLRFENTTMSSFTFQRLQCLQSFTLSKDYNVFIFISKTSISSVVYAFKILQRLHLHFEDFNVFSHLRFLNDCNVFIYISKTSISSVIYAFKRLQCLHLHLKDFNVFSHLRFLKTIMSSFSFQRLQYLQSFTLSKDYNVFIFISKTSISSVVYALKILQCLHLHFKDFNVFSH